MAYDAGYGSPQAQGYTPFGAPFQDSSGQWKQTLKNAQGKMVSQNAVDPAVVAAQAAGAKTSSGSSSTSTASAVNAMDIATKQASDPTLPEGGSLTDKVPLIPTSGADSINNGLVTNKTVNDPSKFNADTATTGPAAQAAAVDPRDAATYTAAQTQGDVAANGQATAQHGTVSDAAQITAPQIDIQGTATGVNADGSTNYTGQALNDYAHQGMEVVDTSTPEGKARALELGDGNYTDSQATLKGQLAKLQSDFVGPNGEPKIPVYAAETARSVSRIAAFKGMTGTAATAAMSQALHEASITVATQDASFFQTLTLQNLNNKQAQTINKANVLAKMDQVNVDNRMAAAIENSKKFMDMDMANLNNDQQTEVLNTQNRVQSILEDAKAVNAQRLFTADSQNEMGKFYDNLNSSIGQFNASQTNNMAQFNTDQTNAQSRFNSDLENNRQQFYNTMQYNVDVSNAKWRQTVTLTNTDMKFQAAATDVKNTIGIQQEALNQLWDRSDALLDYMFKSTENQKDRDATMAGYKMQLDAKDKEGLGAIFGTIAGSGAESLFSNLFGGTGLFK